MAEPRVGPMSKAGRAFPLAAALGSLLVGSSAVPRAAPVGTAATHPPENPRDRHLPDHYVRLIPPAFPTEEEVASGCHSASASAIGELEESGAIVERTLEEYRVRKLACRWAADDPRIAECSFDKASIAGSFGDEEQRRRSIAALRERHWKPAAARLAFVAAAGRFEAVGKPSWVATDTCEPFVFKAGEMEFDLREIARRRKEAGLGGTR